jgi:hypothetical protein
VIRLELGSPGDAGMALCPLSFVIWGVLPPAFVGRFDR